MTNRYLEKIAELFERPATTSGLSPSFVPSKPVNTKKPVESVIKTVARKALTKSAVVSPPLPKDAGIVQKIHEATGRLTGIFGGMGSIVGDAGHLISGGTVRDVVAEAARKKNPYLTHKEIGNLVYKKDHELSKYLTDTVPGNIHDVSHPVYVLERERNKRDAARTLALTGLGGAALYKYKKSKENRYLDAMDQNYYQ